MIQFADLFYFFVVILDSFGYLTIGFCFKRLDMGAKAFGQLRNGKRCKGPLTENTWLSHYYRNLFQAPLLTEKAEPKRKECN